MLVLATLSVILIASSQVAAICDPSPVRDLTLLTNGVLSWKPPADDGTILACKITSYLVFISNGEGDGYVYDVTTTYLDTTAFLKSCAFYTFTVTPVAVHDQGHKFSIKARTLPAKNQTYTITSVSTTQQNQDILMKWVVPSGSDACILSYRVAYEKDNDVYPTDVYTSTMNYTLKNAVSCQTYKFTVRPIGYDFIEGNVIYANHKTDGTAPQVPSLREIIEKDTYVKMTWQINSSDIHNDPGNKCEITRMYIISPNFQLTYNVTPSENGLFNVTVDNLKPNNVYITQVFIANSKGKSNGLQVILQTTPSANETVPTYEKEDKETNNYDIIQRQDLKVPILKDIDQKNTTITMSWKLDYSSEDIRLHFISSNFHLNQEVTASTDELFNITLRNLRPETAYFTSVYVSYQENVSKPVQVILKTGPFNQTEYETENSESSQEYWEVWNEEDESDDEDNDYEYRN